MKHVAKVCDGKRLEFCKVKFPFRKWKSVVKEATLYVASSTWNFETIGTLEAN